MSEKMSNERKVCITNEQKKYERNSKEIKKTTTKKLSSF
jgi:hypothetical protein